MNFTTNWPNKIWFKIKMNFGISLQVLI